METEVFVHVDLEGAPVFVGRLSARMRRGRDSANLEYDNEWLGRAHVGLTHGQSERMASAFEHDDIRSALA